MLLAQLWLAGASLQGGAGRLCAGADQGAPTGAGLWVGDLREGAVPEGGECRLPLLWPALEGLGCVFAVFWLYGCICMEKPAVVW